MAGSAAPPEETTSAPPLDTIVLLAVPPDDTVSVPPLMDGADSHPVNPLGGGVVDDGAARGCPEDTIWLPLITVVPLIEAPDSTSWVPPLKTVPPALPPDSTPGRRRC